MPSRKDSANRIAIVGGGPRAVSVTEQLILASREAQTSIVVDVFDSTFPGAGRVWDPRQSHHLLMNTHAREVTIFSGGPDEGPTRAGSGPSLEQWLEWQGEVLDIEGYAPRAVYGAYLQFAFEAMQLNAAPFVHVEGRTGTVTSVKRKGDGFAICTATGGRHEYQTVVLATGHPRPKPLDLVDQSTGRIIAGDSAADLRLDMIAPNETIATKGMGLSFHDIVALLTRGRGGHFEPSESGLVYAPSGREPTIVGVSRSGLPIPSRGVNQKPGDYKFVPALCTVERMSSLRLHGQVDFYTQVQPWIMAEASASYTSSLLESRASSSEAAEFMDEVRAIDADPLGSVCELAEKFGVTEHFPSLEQLARPFVGHKFSSQDGWVKCVSSHIKGDINAAEQGNVDHPLKAALDTLRDLRPSIRVIADHGGLTPESHENDFLRSFAPLYSLMVAGPPVQRNKELIALIDAGIVTISPPGSRIVDPGFGKFEIVSEAVPETIRVDRVVDARIPGYEVGRCQSVLFPQLLGDGLVRRYRHAGDYGSVETGASETNPDTGNAIDVRGELVDGLFLIGIPTERQRWFTQIGNARPGVESGFTVEARKIAQGALRHIRITAEAEMVTV